MPVTFHNEIEIARPVDEVFEFLCDFRNMPKWNYYIIMVEKMTTGPIQIGTEFHQTRKIDSQKYKITKLIKPSLVAMQTLPPERQLEVKFELKVVNGRTLVKDTWTAKIPSFIGWFGKKRVQHAVMENLLKLKTLLETGSVELQDGRRIDL
ncbi:MAG: SRPBCC family protein [Bacteroidota bacterium]